MNADEYWGRKCSMCKHFRYNRDPALYLHISPPASGEIPLKALCVKHPNRPGAIAKNFPLELESVCEPYKEINPGCQDFDHPDKYKCEY